MLLFSCNVCISEIYLVNKTCLKIKQGKRIIKKVTC